jgi:hypothetical protein
MDDMRKENGQMDTVPATPKSTKQKVIAWCSLIFFILVIAVYGVQKLLIRNTSIALIVLFVISAVFAYVLRDQFFLE